MTYSDELQLATEPTAIEQIDRLARDIVAPAKLEEFDVSSSNHKSFSIDFNSETESTLQAEGKITISSTTIRAVIQSIMDDDEGFDDIISLLSEIDIEDLDVQENSAPESAFMDALDIIRETLPFEPDAFYLLAENEVGLVVLALMLQHLDDDND